MVRTRTSGEGGGDRGTGAAQGVVAIQAVVVGAERKTLSGSADRGVGETHRVGTGASCDAAGDHRLTSAVRAAHIEGVTAISRIRIGTESDIATDRGGIADGEGIGS